jgi:hypothetical protein
MDWKDVAKKVSEFAPLLGTVIGGPAGTAAGGAIALLCSALGIKDEDADPQRVLEAIMADPQSSMKLREVEYRHQEKLQELSLASDGQVLYDRQSARASATEQVKATGTRDVAMYGLAAVIVVGFFLLTVVMMVRPLPAGSTEAVFLLFGALSGAFGSVVAYFFGSSKGSSDKTALLAARKDQ